MKKIFFASLLFISASAVGQGPRPLADSSAFFHRIGGVFFDSAGRNFEAPSIIPNDINPVILTGLTKVFKMYYTWTDASNHVNIGYAESADGIGHWFRKVAAVVSGHRSSCIRKFGSTYYLYAALGLGGSQIDEYSSTDGVTFTSVAAGIVTLGTTGTWNGQGVFNTWVDTATIAGTLTYMMLVDGQSNSGFLDGLYTSTDNATWTAYSGNPVTTITSPYWVRVGSTYIIRGGLTGSTGILPTDIFRQTSPDMHAYTFAPIMPVFRRETASEGVNSSFGQVQDMCDVQVVLPNGDTCVYRYSIATPNGNSSGGAFIELSIFHGSQYQLSLSNENADKYPRFENNGTNAYYNQPLVIGSLLPPSAMLDVEPTTRFNGRATIAAANFTNDSLVSQAVYGFNMEFGLGLAGVNAGWGQRNPTIAGYGIVPSVNGITHDAYVAGASVPTPLAVESLVSGKYILQLGNVSATPNVYWGQATDNGSGMQFQMNGNSMQTTNIKMNSAMNGYFFGPCLGAISTNLGIGTTQPFASGTTGGNNLAIQTFMNSLSTAGGDVGIGQSALGPVTTGNFNTAVGTIAGQSHTTGNFGSYFGRSSGSGNTSGNENSAFGANSLRNNATHNFMTALGAESGYQDGTGVSSAAAIDTSTFVGAYAQGGQSSTVFIGGIGKLKDRVGIGTYLPRAWLHLPSGLGIPGYPSLKMDYSPIATTTLTGNGSQMTIGFSAPSDGEVPYMSGQQIRISGATPTGYNGVWTVGSSTTTQVVVSGTVTGSQTGAGTITPYSKPTRSDIYGFGWDLDSLFAVDKDSVIHNITFPTVAGDGNGIYTGSGSLSANTTVTLGSNNLTFSGAGAVSVPTVAITTNNTQVATTAAVTTAIANANPKVFSMTADGSVSNTSTPTTLIGTGVGSQTIAANALSVGSVVTFKGSGTITTAVTAPSLAFNFVAGSSGNSISPTIGAALNSAYEFEMTGIVRTSGSSGTLSMTGWVSIAGTKTYIATGNYAINTTTGQLIDLVLTMGGTVGTGDTVTTKNATIFVN